MTQNHIPDIVQRFASQEIERHSEAQTTMVDALGDNEPPNLCPEQIRAM